MEDRKMEDGGSDEGGSEDVAWKLAWKWSHGRWSKGRRRMETSEPGGPSGVRFTFHVSRLTFHVSHFTSHVSHKKKALQHKLQGSLQ